MNKKNNVSINIIFFLLLCLASPYLFHMLTQNETQLLASKKVVIFLMQTILIGFGGFLYWNENKGFPYNVFLKDLPGLFIIIFTISVLEIIVSKILTSIGSVYFNIFISVLGIYLGVFRLIALAVFFETARNKNTNAHQYFTNIKILFAPKPFLMAMVFLMGVFLIKPISVFITGSLDGLVDDNYFLFINIFNICFFALHNYLYFFYAKKYFLQIVQNEK